MVASRTVEPQLPDDDGDGRNSTVAPTVQPPDFSAIRDSTSFRMSATAADGRQVGLADADAEPLLHLDGDLEGGEGVHFQVVDEPARVGDLVDGEFEHVRDQRPQFGRVHGCRLGH